MGLFSKIKLSWRFGKMTYIVSAILSLSIAVSAVNDPTLIPGCILVKVASIPVIHYLNVNLTKDLGIYFYINLGFSRREYYFLPFVVEFIPFVLLMIITGYIGYALG